MKDSLQSLWARLATPTARDQRGIALLLTLGVLSLLLVLAMSFAYSTRTERQAAGNNADLIKARLLAESGLERVIATIRYAIAKGEHFGPNCSDSFSLIHKGTGAQWTDFPFIFTPTTTDAADLIGSSLETILGSYTLPPGTETNSANWIHITGDDGKLIGRIAYVALPLFAQTSTDSFKVFSESSLPWRFDADAWYDSSLAVDHQRFNVNRPVADWSSTFSGAAGIATLTTNGSLPNYWNPSPPIVNTAVANRIPWLATMTDAGGTSLANQVAANVIDYCDADNNPTTNYVATPGNWPVANDAPPTFDYCGLEKVPYINEVSFVGTMTYDSTANQTTFSIIAYGEAINQYVGTMLSGFNLEIDVTWDGIPATATTDSPTNATSVGAKFMMAIPNLSQGYTPNTLQKQYEYSWTGSSNAKIKTVYGFIRDSGNNVVDMAEIADSSTVTFSTGTNTVDYQVYDPRCNTSKSQWVEATPPSLGSVNNNSSPTANSSNNDAEDAVDPVNVSTACIRNAPMQTLWELGAIHRGEAWRTLNLSKYNSTVTTGTLSYTYTDGDANILDQVKLNDTASFPIRGRLNVNSPQPEWWTFFLTNIKRGATTYTDTSGGTPLTDSDISGIFDTSTAGGLFTVNGAYEWATVDNKPFTNRGEIAKCTKLSTGTTDLAREEIIGKLADKLTARPNYFTVIVLAQSVKDTGVVPATGTVSYGGGGNCLVLAEQKILAVVSRDAFTDKFVIESFEYLDE